MQRTLELTFLGIALTFVQGGCTESPEACTDAGGDACVASATCDDRLQNQGEEGVDCGGPCPDACAAAPTCDDRLQNQGEEGIDCGGPCLDACTAEPTCDDGVLNQGEDEVDCGGPCAACAASTCGDGERSAGEDGIDCGGPCPSACELLVRDEIHNFTDEDCGWYFWYDTDRFPDDLSSPARFTQGRIYTRYEILDQPTTTASGFQFVMWKRLGDELAGAPMGFAGGGDSFAGTGSVGVFDEALDGYWVEGEGVDLTDVRNVWRQGIAVHEHANGWISCPAWGYPAERWDRRASWFPMRLRFTIVAVAAGAEFSGWDRWTPASPTDGESTGPSTE